MSRSLQVRKQFNKMSEKYFYKEVTTGIKTSAFRKKAKYEPNDKKPKGPEILLLKLKNIGETILGKLPVKRIVPILKKNENRNFMWIVFFVIKFVKKLREKTFVSKYNKLTTQHFQLINDNSRVCGDFRLMRRLTTNQHNEAFLHKRVLNLFFEINGSQINTD